MMYAVGNVEMRPSKMPEAKGSCWALARANRAVDPSRRNLRAASRDI